MTVLLKSPITWPTLSVTTEVFSALLKTFNLPSSRCDVVGKTVFLDVLAVC